LNRGVTLGINIEKCLGEFFKQIRQQRNGFLAINACSRNFLPSHFIDATFGAAGTKEIVVVKSYEISITRELHIGFKVSITKFNGMTKCRNCVFWKLVSPTAMRKGNELAVVVRG
jgi:hypothetical protein